MTSECPAQFSIDYGFSCSLTHCSNTIKTTGKHDLSTLSEPIPRLAGTPSSPSGEPPSLTCSDKTAVYHVTFIRY